MVQELCPKQYALIVEKNARFPSSLPKDDQFIVENAIQSTDDFNKSTSV